MYCDSVTSDYMQVVNKLRACIFHRSLHVNVAEFPSPLMMGAAVTKSPK
jgi:hypothetical protein